MGGIKREHSVGIQILVLVVAPAFAGCGGFVAEHDINAGLTLPELDAGMSLAFRLDSTYLFSIASRTYSYSDAPDGQVSGTIRGTGVEQLKFTIEAGTMKLADPWGTAVDARPVRITYHSPNGSGVVGREWINPDSGMLIREDFYQAWFEGPAPYASISTEPFGRPALLDASVFAGRTLTPGEEFTVTAPLPVIGSRYEPGANQSWVFRVEGVEDESGARLLRVDLVNGTFIAGPYDFPMIGSFWFDGKAPTFVKRSLAVTIPSDESDAAPVSVMYSNVSLAGFERHDPPPEPAPLRETGALPPAPLEPYDGFAPPDGDFQGRFTLREAVTAGQGLDPRFVAYRAQHPEAQIYFASYRKEVNGTAETWSLELMNPQGDALYRIVVGRLTSASVPALILYYVDEGTALFEPGYPPVYLDARIVPPLAPFGYVLDVVEAVLPEQEVWTVYYANSFREYSIPLELPEGVLAGITPLIEIGTWGGYFNLYEGPLSGIHLAGLPQEPPLA